MDLYASLYGYQSAKTQASSQFFTRRDHRKMDDFLILTKEEFLAITSHAAEGFLNAQDRISKIPYHMDREVLDKIIEMAVEA